MINSIFVYFISPDMDYIFKLHKGQNYIYNIHDHETLSNKINILKCNCKIVIYNELYKIIYEKSVKPCIKSYQIVC